MEHIRKAGRIYKFTLVIRATWRGETIERLLQEYGKPIEIVDDMVTGDWAERQKFLIQMEREAVADKFMEDLKKAEGRLWPHRSQ